MPSLKQQLFLYLLGRPDSLQTHLWKLGYHTGTRETLRQRYITSIPDLIIARMYEHEHAKTMENFIKQCFSQSRLENEGGNLSEFFRIPLENFDAIIRSVMTQYDETGVLASPGLLTFFPKRKRAHCDKTNAKQEIIGLTVSSETLSQSRAANSLPQLPDQYTSALNNLLPHSLCNMVWLYILERLKTSSTTPQHWPLLMDFLWIADASQDFQIRLQDIVSVLAVHGMKMRKTNLMRQLRKLKSGKDYREDKGVRVGGTVGRRQRDHWLTVAAYKKICLRMRTPVQEALTDYFVTHPGQE
jgi:hypothetical protein